MKFVKKNFTMNTIFPLMDIGIIIAKLQMAPHSTLNRIWIIIKILIMNYEIFVSANILIHLTVNTVTNLTSLKVKALPFEFG